MNRTVHNMQSFNPGTSVLGTIRAARFALLMIGLSTVENLIRGFGRYHVIDTSRRVEYAMRGDLLEHLQQLDLAYFQHQRIGDLMARLTNDLQAVRQMVGFGILMLTNTLLMLLFTRLHANERIDEFAALARTLGANRLAVLRRVTLPLLLRRAAPSLSLLFAGVFGAYEIPLLLGAQRPEMISILARRKFALFDLHQRPEAFLIAVIYAAIVLTLVLLAFRKQTPAHVG